jgi:hypothetical protein
LSVVDGVRARVRMCMSYVRVGTRPSRVVRNLHRCHDDIVIIIVIVIIIIVIVVRRYRWQCDCHTHPSMGGRGGVCVCVCVCVCAHVRVGVSPPHRALGQVAFRASLLAAQLGLTALRVSCAAYIAPLSGLVSVASSAYLNAMGGVVCVCKCV